MRQVSLSVLGFSFFLLGMSECNAGAPNQYKLHHVKGRIQCQSEWNIGYYCQPDPEVRDATDCGSGHERLKRMSGCCAQVYISGKKQDNGRLINYFPGSCSPLF